MEFPSSPYLYLSIDFKVSHLFKYTIYAYFFQLDRKSAENGIYTPDGKYNIMAQLLSDNSHIPVRMAIFSGTSKADNMYSVRELGNQCLLYSLDDAFREAIINAFLHNKWVDGNEPMITVYSDRIEILSRATLPREQTMEGFFQENLFRLIKNCPRFSCSCISVGKQEEVFQR